MKHSRQMMYNNNNRAIKIEKNNNNNNIDNISYEQQQQNQLNNIQTNRLNYVQELITKLNKKINKLQKTIISTQQLHQHYKQQITQKITQIIQVSTQQQLINQQHNQRNNNNIKVIESIDAIKEQIRRLSKNNNKLSDKCNSIEQKLEQIQNVQRINNREIYHIVEEKLCQIEKRISHQISSNISHMYQLIDKININMKQSNHNNNIYTKQYQLTKPTNQYHYKNQSQNHCKYSKNTIIQSPKCTKNNNSIIKQHSLSKQKLYNKTQSLSKQKYNKTLRNQQQQPQNNQQQQYHPLSNRLQINNNLSDIFNRKQQAYDSTTNNVKSQSYNNNSNKNTNQQSNIPVSQNNSRVVYLRQKLKQFQNINQKYSIKSTNTSIKNQQFLSTNHQVNSGYKNYQENQSNKKRLQQHYANNTLSSQASHSQQYGQKSLTTTQQNYNILLSTNKKPNTKQTIQPQKQKSRLQSFQRQSSSSASSKKSILNQGYIVMNRQQSAKKIDKLKSIRDYLQQTQSQIDDQSLLQPSYD